MKRLSKINPGYLFVTGQFCKGTNSYRMSTRLCDVLRYPVEDATLYSGIIWNFFVERY